MIKISCPKCSKKFASNVFPVPLEVRCPGCNQLLRLRAKPRAGSGRKRRVRQFLGAHRMFVILTLGVLVIGAALLAKEPLKDALKAINKAVLQDSVTTRPTTRPTSKPAVKEAPPDLLPNPLPPTSRPGGGMMPDTEGVDRLEMHILKAHLRHRLGGSPLPDPNLAASVARCLAGGKTVKDALAPEQLFAAVSPSVVRISVMKLSNYTGGMGSGFLISDDGLILTNYHVINGAWSATARLPDERLLNVSGIVAVDPAADLALIKADGKNTPAVEIAAGEMPLVGAKVYAIGSPQGLFNTFSEGMISGHRQMPTGPAVILQTTAPVSKGSSGGPLVSADGRVVGVCYQVFRDGQNLNFAIPAEVVRDFLVRAAQACKGEASE